MSEEAYTSRGINQLLQIIEEFRKLQPDMQMQTAAVFLTVALEPGITSKDIGKRTGIVQASCSRNISLLSKKARHDKDGMDLVEAVEDPYERRRKIVNLTPKGKRVAASLYNVIKNIEDGE